MPTLKKSGYRIPDTRIPDTGYPDAENSDTGYRVPGYRIPNVGCTNCCGTLVSCVMHIFAVAYFTNKTRNSSRNALVKINRQNYTHYWWY